MKTTPLLNHAAEIQGILSVKTSKFGIEVGQSFIKIQINETLDYLNLEPMLDYCKKQKVNYRIRAGVSAPVLEIEISIA